MSSRLRQGLRSRNLLEMVVVWWRKLANFRSLLIDADGLGMFSAESVEDVATGCCEIVL